MIDVLGRGLAPMSPDAYDGVQCTEKTSSEMFRFVNIGEIKPDLSAGAVNAQWAEGVQARVFGGFFSLSRRSYLAFA
jgi:hypothetical protein